jgi:hypothetical protein
MSIADMRRSKISVLHMFCERYYQILLHYLE